MFIRSKGDFNGNCRYALLVAAVALATVTSAFAQVRISQVYTQGGVGGSGAFDFDSAPYHADFVELYNAGGAPVDISGYSLQFAGPTSTTTWTKFDLTGAGNIAPNSYFLVRMTEPLANGGPYSFDLSRTGTASPIISTGGKVALVSNQVLMANGACPSGGAVVDFVGISGTSVANCSETAPIALANNPRLSVFRKCGGTTETDNNSSDFEARPVYPHFSGSPAFPGIEVTVNLTSAATNPCFPTTVGFQSVVRGVSTLLITVSRNTCSGAPSTGGTVTADLTEIGGPAAQPLFDDATNGDVTSGDNIYSYNFTVPANAPLGINRQIIVTVSDAQSRTQTGVARILVENFTPPNDVCVSATLITSVPFIDSDINNRLAGDDGQPSCLSGSTLVRRGVWYTYQPAQTGFAIISESGSQNSVIAVYSGPDCSNLTSLTAAQNGCYIAASTNQRFVPMNAGTTYWILIGPSATNTNCPTTHANLTFEFDYAVTPNNDFCSGAIDLTSATLPYTATVQNIAATDDPGVTCAPTANGNQGKRGVWYRYTPPSTGVITLNESGSQNALHAVFSGSCISLALEFCFTTDTNQGAFVIGGETYFILLASDATGAPTNAPPFAYTFDFTPLAPPANSTLCTAQDVSAGGTFTVDNRAATNEDIEFTLCLGSGSAGTKLAVFYKYTAASDCVLKVNETSTQDIAITAYQGSTCNSAAYLTCTTSDSLILPVATGQTYWFMIGHPNSTFTFPTADLSTTFTCSQPPVNDTACTAAPLTLNTNISLDNSFALPDADVSCNSSNAQSVWHGVWYTYTPGANCTAGLNETSSQNAVMTVYTGSNCNDLTEYYCTDVDQGDFVDLFSGQQYWILVGINSSSAPAVPSVNQVVNISCGTPIAGDACPSAITIASLPFATSIDNSTFNANMPRGQCDPNTITPPGSMRNDVWHKYVATSNCVAQINADPSSNYDAILQVWEGPDCQSLTLIGCSDYHASSNGTPEIRNVNMTAGRTYWIQFGKVGTTSAGGISNLTVDCEPGPTNDLSCNATVVGSFPFFDSVDISRASNDIWMSDIIATNPNVNFCGSGDPTESYYGIWYTYTATSNCSLIIEDTGSLDVAIGAFVGSCNSLFQIGCTGASTFETLSIPMSVGQQYWFLVSVFGFSQPDPILGTIDVTIDCRNPPANDTECNATDLNSTGLPYFTSVDVAAATDDNDFIGTNCTSNDDPVAANGTWYTYSPETDCTLTVSDGPDTNVSFAIYEGFDCFGLSELVCSSSDSISFGLTSGNSYWILAAQNGPNPGMPTQAQMSLIFDCSQPPPNDLICNATVIGSTPFAASQSISLATDDFDIACNQSSGNQTSQKGVWWRYTPTTDCIAQINETSSLGVAIAVFEGSDCNGVFEAACTSAENFGYAMFANQTYWIMISLETTTATVPTANLSMTFDCVSTNPPANDVACTATVIGSLPYYDNPVIAAATHDSDVPCNQVDATSVNYGVWYNYTPSVSCTLILAESSLNNAVWAIYSGADCNNLNEVGCSATDTGSSISLNAGTNYWILVGVDWSSNGEAPTTPGLPLQIMIDCASVPLNDTCGSAELVNSLPFTSSYNPFFAADGTPAGSCNSPSTSSMDNDVWFTWTAPGNCDITVDLQDTSPAFPYGQMTVVYAGPDCNNLFEVVCRYSSGSTNQLPFSFTAIAGETYWFQNGRRFGSTGSSLGPTDFSLSGECTAGCATCPADMSGDSELDGEDVQRFTECVILANNGAATSTCECADVLVDNVVNSADITEFVNLLLQSNPPCP